MYEASNCATKIFAIAILTGGAVLVSSASPAASNPPSPAAGNSLEFQLDTVLVQGMAHPGQGAADADGAKDAEQDRQSVMEDLYHHGRDALDDGNYSSASETFRKLAQMGGPQTDAALYWLAYCDNKMGRRDSALESIADLKRRFPQSRWKKDAEALEIEIRQNSGRPVNPASQTDDDLKILALQGVMNNDPSKGIPMVEKYLNGSATPSNKSKALFMLVQSGSPQGQEMLANIASGQGNPELQKKAIEYLAMCGGPTSSKLLAQIYSSTSDTNIKRAVLHSYMISGNRESLEIIAKSETNESLKLEAIRELGITHDISALQALYPSEKSIDAKNEILQALFLAGDSARLSQLALSESNPELRKTAIHSLGLMGAKDPALQTIYAKETDRGVKEEVLNAYFIGGNASALVAIAKTEKDPKLKEAAVSKLALMHSKEGNDYLMDLLQE